MRICFMKIKRTIQKHVRILIKTENMKKKILMWTENKMTDWVNPSHVS